MPIQGTGAISAGSRSSVIIPDQTTQEFDIGRVIIGTGIGGSNILIPPTGGSTTDLNHGTGAIPIGIPSITPTGIAGVQSTKAAAFTS